MLNDAELLSAYTQTRSAEALRQLIERHINFVYASALRQVKDPAQAEDVTQAVFIILTRKAASIRPAALTGWLFNTTRHCAANARRSELRRRRHERQAAKPEVQMQLEDSAAPSLDHALSCLRHGDREVVLLRYFQDREFAEVGSILGISEQTARRRLSRAVERLRQLLGVGGQILPSAAVIQALTASTPPAPAHLSAAISAAIGNAAASSTAAALATKTLHVMNWIKIKIAATIILAATVAGAGSVAIVKAVGPQSTADTAVVPSESPAPAPATVAPIAAVPGAVATFPDGMRVELLGIAPSPVRSQKWWRPDGSPLAQPPIRREYGQVTAPNSKVYTFVVKLTGSAPTWDTGINVEGSNGTASNDQGNLLTTIVALSKSPTATLDFICANGAWQTRAIISASALYTTGVNLNGIVFAPGDDPKTNTVKLTADHASMNALFNGAARFVAIDINGKIVPSSSMNGRGNLLTETKTYSFNKLRPDQIAQFEIRSRPFNRTVKFQNISLIPGQLTAPTVEQHDTGKFVANFTAGGAVEVIGISNWPPTNKWWQPDGTPLDKIPPDYSPYMGPAVRGNERAYAVAIRWTNPHDSPSWYWEFPSSRAIGVPSRTHDVPPNSPDVFGVTLPAAATTMTFRTGLASGPWHAWPIVKTTVAASVSIDNTTISFSAPTEEANSVTVITNDNLQNVDRQLVAIDLNGVTHTATLLDTKSTPTTKTNTYQFPSLTKAQIKSYQLQTREYEYVNFKNLPLKPDQHTEVTIEPDPPALPSAPPKPPGEEGL